MIFLYNFLNFFLLRSSIYPAELVMAADRTPFHKACVRCNICKAITPEPNLGVLFFDHDDIFDIFWKLYFDSGVNLEKFDSIHFDRAQSTAVLPRLLPTGLHGKGWKHLDDKCESS